LGVCCKIKTTRCIYCVCIAKFQNYEFASKLAWEKLAKYDLSRLFSDSQYNNMYVRQPLTSMSANMLLEVAGGLESLITVRLGAGVGLLTGVDAHVRLEPITRRECLATLLILTSEWPVAGVGTLMYLLTLPHL